MFNDEDAFEYENINDTVLATHAVAIIINVTAIMNIIVILIMIIFHHYRALCKIRFV